MQKDSSTNDQNIKLFCQKVEKITSELDKIVPVIPVLDNGEPIVSAAEIEGLEILSPESCLVRKTVFEKLKTIQSKLSTEGIAVKLYEGWRSLEQQQATRERIMAEIKAKNPEIFDANELAGIANRFIAPPEVATHLTGGTVDVTLFDLATGTELDMGTPVNHSSVESYTDFPHINAEARANREKLKKVMVEAGFASWPTEWWHYTFGTVEDAAVNERQMAFYGPINIEVSPAN